jgi:glycosyltransferase involved in cell wall biosynthesis/Tfp pilus assembly protein PilF
MNTEEIAQKLSSILQKLRADQQDKSISQVTAPDVPLFSVLVPTYNQARFLPAALDSLLAQTYSNWEAVVVNDGSTDDTAQVMREYATRDNRFKMFHKPNGGVGSALNEGIRQARGQWICWLSSDDLFEPNKLEIHFKEINENPDIYFFYSHFSYIDEAASIKLEGGLWNPIPDPPFQVSRFFHGPYIHGNSFAIHRDVFRVIGLFDERLHNAQDFDMWLRISAKYPSHFIDRRTCITRNHLGQATVEFPEAGFFDSALAAIEFINRTPFSGIFPLLNLSDPNHILAAVKETIDITINPSALIHSCGPATALIDRLSEWLENTCDSSLQPVIRTTICQLVEKLENNQEIVPKIRDAMISLKCPTGYVYQKHNVIMEIILYIKELELHGDMEKCNLLRRYIYRITSRSGAASCLKVVRFPEDNNVRVLFYYPNLYNSDHSFAGINAATISLVRELARMRDNYLIHLTGNHATRKEKSEKAWILPMPNTEELSYFLTDYDVVVFATNLQHFQDIPKPIGQSWILQHPCWRLEPAELSRINDFDQIISLSKCHQEAIISQDVPYAKVQVVPNGVDTNIFLPNRTQRKPRSIMFAGSVVPDMGVHILLQAFPLIRKNYPNAQLHIYGSTTMWLMTSDYEKQLKRLALKGCYFHNPVPNRKMPDIYSRHGILCLPTQLKITGMVTIEAQACGCIPIVHDMGGIPATFIDGETGFLYESNTPEALSETIIKAFEAIDSNPSMRFRAVEFVRMQFDIASTAKQYATLIDQLWKAKMPDDTYTTEDLARNNTGPLQKYNGLRNKDIDIFRTMPVLLCYPGVKEIWQSSIISENEVFCGPDCTTVSGAVGLKEIKTSTGLYQIPIILDNIPKTKWPELYVVRPSMNNRPVNAGILSCPRVMIIGKEFYDPLQTNILAEYVKTEKFDYMLIDTTQVPVELFDFDTEQKPSSLYSILTGCMPKSEKKGADTHEFIQIKQESLSVLSNLLLMGERLYSAGKTVEAMKCFTYIITNSSDNNSRCQAFSNIGVIAHSMHDMNRAEQMFLSALEIDSVDINALLNLSDLYLTQGHHGQALSVLDNAFAAHPGNEQISEKRLLCINASPMPKYPDNKTIAFFLGQRKAYRPIMFSINEVFCSPDCESTTINGITETIKTNGSVYDIKQVIDQLSPSQTPELIVVKTDASGRNFPINLQQYNCPKLLILGDTHHLKKPIQTLLVYAAQEKFDYIISDHGRHHLHYFKEAGFNNVFWIPCFNIYPHEQALSENNVYDVSFVGSFDRWHPYREAVLQFLQTNDVPVQIMQAPHEKAAEIYAKSLINLNISLNGDFNLRVFEVLSSGGFLLTDRLSRESGLEMIFKDGEHLVCYDSPQDLLEKIHYYLNHPSEAKAIAQKGYEEYKRHHTPETKTNELMDFILKGRLNPLYEIQKDSRSIHVTSKSKEDIFQRISTYEYFQDVHLKNHEPAALFFPSVDPRLLCDVSDLPRLRLYIKGIETDIPDTSLQLFNDTNIADRIHALSSEDLKKIQGAWDIIVLTASDLVDRNLEDFLISMNFKLLVVSDSFSSIDEDSRVKLLEYFSANGLEKIHENPDVFFWKDKSLWGEYLFSKGFTADAVKNFERALADNPANENALNNLGVISYQLNRYEAAEKFMVKSVSLNRRNINSLNNLVQLYMTMERFEDAAGLLLEITGMNPEQPEPWYLLGLCQERLNQLDRAFDAFKKAENFDGSTYPMPEGLHVQLDKSMFEKNNSQARIPPKKILVINNLYPPQEMGGYGRLLFDFTNILRNRGHSIYVLTSDSPYLGNTDGDKPDVHRSFELFGGWEGGVCKTMENPADIIRIVRKNIAGLEQVLKEFRPDACLLGNIDFLSKNIIDPMLDKKIPIIHHLGNQQPGYVVNETPKNRLYHLAAASNWLKNEIQNQGYPLKDISVVFPGALVEEFRMRIPPALDKLRIVYASIVLPYKGPHILINALKRLHDSGIDFYCSIAGTSTDQGFVDSLKSYVIGTGMEEKIHFLGFLAREELKNLFARHNVLVFPSIVKEAFGISQVEAMAAGLTVVTSGTGGAKEIVEHGVSGIIFKTEDDASLAEELIQLTKDPLKCQQIALAGQRRAIEKFDIERSVDSLESCFARLLQTKGIR